jgi:enoyl-CoA hydratase
VKKAMADFELVGTWCGFECAGAEARWRARRRSISLQRALAEHPQAHDRPVQGKCIAGGSCSAWPCDLIVRRSRCDVFLDNTVSMGVARAEFFAHPWEVGIRKAKEMLFTRPIG